VAIRVELNLDNGEFTSRMVGAVASVEQFQAKVGGATSSLRTFDGASKGFVETLRDVAVTFSAVTFAFGKIKDLAESMVGDIIKVNAEMEALTVTMKNMSTASDPVKEAAENVKFLRDMIQEVPFSLKALTQSFTQMKTSGLDPMGGMLKNLADGVAAMGGTDATLERASLAITQMSGKSVIQMEELRRQLGEAVPNAVQIMARSMGTTIAGLNNAVGTGALEAKQALQLFSDELERSFGGGSHEMMETFNGQMRRLTASFQNLQLRVGERGFFENLKSQIGDINNFLNSNMADRLSTMVGDGLNTGLNWIRAFVEKVIDLRHEIIAVGEAFAIGFAGKVAISGIQSIAAQFASLGGEISKFRRAMAELRAEQVANNLAMGWGGDVLGGRAISTFERASVGASNFAIALRGVGTGLAAIGPALPAIGMGIAIIIEYFDIFGFKAKAAYDELEKFGAVSRDGLEKAEGFLAEKKALLAALLDEKDKVGYDTLALMGRGDIDKQISDLRALIIKAEEVVKKGHEQQGDSEAKRRANAEMELIQKEMSARRAEYVKQAKEDENNATEEHNNAVKNRESADEVDKKYGILRLERARKENEDMLKILEDNIRKQTELYANGTKLERDAAEKVVNQLNEQALQKVQERNRLDGQIRLQTPTLQKPLNEENAFKKGQEALVKLQAEVIGLQAGLSGANAEVVALYELLERSNKFGFAKEVARVQELIEKIRDLKQVKEELNDLDRGKKEIETDLAKLETKYTNQIIDAQTKGMSDLDKLAVKINAGLIPGFGPKQTEVQKAALAEISNEMKSTDAIAKTLGKTWLEQTFGSSAKSAADAMLNTFQQMAFTMGIIKDKSDFGIGFSGKVLDFKPGGRGVGTGEGTSFAGGERELAIRTLIGEAIGESDAGLAAVANVIKNRYGSGKFGGSLSDVITAPGQFSVWNKGDPAGDMARGVSVDDARFKRAAAIWDAVASGAIPDNTAGSVNYANKATATSKEDWLNRLDTRIGAHSFGTHMGTYSGPINYGDSQMPPPDQLPTDLKQKWNDVAAKGQEAGIAQLKSQMEDLMDQARKDIDKFQADGEDFQKHKNEMIAKIKSGTTGLKTKDTDPTSDFWKPYIDLLEQVDQKDQYYHDRREARSKAKSAAEQINREAMDDDAKKEENAIRLKDINETKYTDASIRRMQARKHQLDAINNSPDMSEITKTELRQKAAAGIESIREEEIEKQVINMAKQDKALEQSLMTEGQKKAQAYNEELDRLNKMEEEYKAHGNRLVEVTEEIERRKKLIRDQYNQSGALTQQMKGFAEIGTNLEKSMSGWIGSFNDNLATALTRGKVNWKSFAETILKDLSRLGLQIAESLLFKLVMNAGGDGILSGLRSGLDGLVGVGKSHTGSIIGADHLATSMVNPGVFAGAQRYHSGGMIGRDEVPIIAQKGEGVFTAEQMKALPGLYGGKGDVHVNIHAPVNANGGTPEQNADLAKQVSRALEGSVRGVIIDEIRKQQKPGNILNR
jgi:tape measure domain-containing protein